MSKNILVVFAALALLLAGPIACKKGGGDAADNIVGTWTVDVDSMLEEVPEEEREMARAMMQMMGDLTMTFGDDDSLTIAMGEGESQSGSYEVTSSEGDTLSMTLTSNEGEASDVTVTFVSEDQVRIEPVDEEASGPQTMVLNRVE